MEATALSRPPNPYLRSAEARVRLVRDFSCDVEHDDRTQRVDLPRSQGGGATGPHPGQLLRASLGACLVMGYRAWSARLGIPLDSVTLTIRAEFDERGQLGLDASVPVGWQRVVVDVVLTSSADGRDVLRLADTVHRLSPMLANLSPSVERVFHLTVVPSSESAAAL